MILLVPLSHRNTICTHTQYKIIILASYSLSNIGMYIHYNVHIIMIIIIICFFINTFLILILSYSIQILKIIKYINIIIL